MGVTNHWTASYWIRLEWNSKLSYSLRYAKSPSQG